MPNVLQASSCGYKVAHPSRMQLGFIFARLQLLVKQGCAFMTALTSICLDSRPGRCPALAYACRLAHKAGATKAIRFCICNCPVRRQAEQVS